MSEAPHGPPDGGWKKLHPLSVGVNLIPRTWILLRQVWPLMVGWFVLGRVPGQAVLDLGVLAMFLSPAIVGTVLHWALLRYRMVGHHLEVETGLLNRQTRLIAVDRVQNVELVRTVFHRIFGLVEVRIETASGKEVEGLLSALSVEDADALLAFLEQGRARAAQDGGPTAPTPEQVIVDANVIDLLWYGATGTRLASVAVLLGFVYEGMIGPGTTPDQLGGASQLGRELAPLLLVAVVTGAWWLGVGSAIGRFYGYRLTRQGDALVSEQGLFTRRAARLGLGKIQTLSFAEPFLRRRLGFGSIAIETASARQEGDGLERAETVVPYVEHTDATRVLRAALPTLPDLDALQLLPAHPWAA
ncbi:MAG: PH domain-containing protein, partial [Myxococcales bacterium]|nr:PH domain-containing protein [Myxococcales bacterium]